MGKRGRSGGTPLPDLKAARAAAGLTLGDLTHDTGLHRDTINRLENLRRGADRKTTLLLSWALSRTSEALASPDRLAPPHAAARAPDVISVERFRERFWEVLKRAEQGERTVVVLPAGGRTQIGPVR